MPDKQNSIFDLGNKLNFEDDLKTDLKQKAEGNDE